MANIIIDWDKFETFIKSIPNIPDKDFNDFYVIRENKVYLDCGYGYNEEKLQFDVIPSKIITIRIENTKLKEEIVKLKEEIVDLKKQVWEWAHE